MSQFVASKISNAIVKHSALSRMQD